MEPPLGFLQERVDRRPHLIGMDPIEGDRVLDVEEWVIGTDGVHVPRIVAQVTRMRPWPDARGSGTARRGVPYCRQVST